MSYYRVVAAMANLARLSAPAPAPPHGCDATAEDAPVEDAPAVPERRATRK